MYYIRLLIAAFFILSFNNVEAQPPVDSAFALKEVPVKYANQLNNKIDKYSSRISSKTEKTLTRLAKWENKIESLLEKASPETADKLFGNQQLTFNTLLQQLKEGKTEINNYKLHYDEYVDKTIVGIKYLEAHKDDLNSKVISPIKDAGKKAEELQKQVNETEYVKSFIKERKKLLIDETTKYIGNSKYLQRINKESYYYVTTLKNYKEIFSDPHKTEAFVKEGLNKIPAFTEFMKKNSQLASMFGFQANGNNVSLVGLQTRSSVQQLIQERIASGGPNAQAQIQQNLAQAQKAINTLKDRIIKSGGSSTNIEIPDFKPNTQRSKTLLQRLEYGFDAQFDKNNSIMPSATNVATNIGYKLNDKSTIGIGISYKIGMGTIEHINLTNEGIGLRSFLDYKILSKAKGNLLKDLWLSGGGEMNYNSSFKKIEQLKNYSAWQSSALLGISKKYKISKKVKGEMKLLYDFLYREHVPASPALIWRLGYKF